jgi:two-component system sensor histidine kinase KdpD
LSIFSTVVGSKAAVCEAIVLRTLGIGGYQGIIRRFGVTMSEDADYSVTDATRVRAALLESIARDLQKPLALILSAATSLKKRGGMAEGSVRGEWVDIIEDEAERLEGFVSILLDMTKLEGNAVEMRPETLALRDVMTVAVRDAAGALQDRKAEVNLSANLPTLRLDPAILRRVLGILIENAAGQTPSGSTVSIQAGRDTAGVRLQIMDEGNGIPPGDLNRMFDQFHLPCADDRRRLGAGMQLAVCRGYIEAMGGTIAAGNRTDRGGAVFTITFPMPP